MAQCEICGNDYDKSFEVVAAGATHVFDSFECAVHALAPVCEHCGCRVIGHGVEADGRFFCCAHCAQRSGAAGARDRLESSCAEGREEGHGFTQPGLGLSVPTRRQGGARIGLSEWLSQLGRPARARVGEPPGSAIAEAVDALHMLVHRRAIVRRLFVADEPAILVGAVTTSRRSSRGEAAQRRVRGPRVRRIGPVTSRTIGPLLSRSRPSNRPRLAGL